MASVIYKGALEKGACAHVSIVATYEFIYCLYKSINMAIIRAEKTFLKPVTAGVAAPQLHAELSKEFLGRKLTEKGLNAHYSVASLRSFFAYSNSVLRKSLHNSMVECKSKHNFEEQTADFGLTMQELDRVMRKERGFFTSKIFERFDGKRMLPIRHRLIRPLCVGIVDKLGKEAMLGLSSDRISSPTVLDAVVEKLEAIANWGRNGKPNPYVAGCTNKANEFLYAIRLSKELQAVGAVQEKIIRLPIANAQSQTVGVVPAGVATVPSN